MIRAALLAVGLVVAFAGCDSEKKEPAKPLELGQSANLQRGTIDTDVTAVRLTDPYVLKDAPTLPKGQHYLAVDLKWVDNGVPFHHDWARFALIDLANNVTKVAILTPLKKTNPASDDKHQPMTQMVVLGIADGQKPQGLVLGSADDRWPFTASWSLR